jgi:lysozyme family protein
MTDRFSVCLPFTLAQECPLPNDWSNPKNFSNDAHDPGGETMCGITQREYDVWRKRDGEPTQDVRLLTKGQGFIIYCESYWDPHCDDLPPGLDLQFFDSSVNEGTTEATRMLQFVLDVEADGLWGPHTAGMVEAIHDVKEVISEFTKRRQAVYKEMKGYQYFGKDWERRASEIGAEALKMVSA